MNRRRGWRLLAVGWALAGIAGCSTADVTARPAAPLPPSASSPAAHADVTFLSDCGEPTQSPATVTLTCADAGHTLQGLTWTAWGRPQATAVGTAVLNTCEPSCAAGRNVTYPEAVVATDLVHGEASATYGRLIVTATGSRPKGVPETEDFPLITVDPAGGPEPSASPSK